MADRVRSPAARREAGALAAAALTRGPAELLDFLLPLWAGAALGAAAVEVGLLVATELAVSVVARPLAGGLADARERRTVAAVGALLYALSTAGYAFAGALPLAFLAAVVGGVGGALLWVPLRAMVGERLAVDPAVFARLLSWQETGVWVAFVAGLSLLPALGYRGLFLGCAAACLVGAGFLYSAPIRPGAVAGAGPPAALRRTGRRLRPLLLTVAATMAAESAVGILLLLHLQRGHGLEPVEIALVYLPGAVVMGLLPGPLHRLAVAFGRRRVLALGSVASALFAVGLSFAPTPGVLAAAWVLSAAAWAAVIPVQQAVVAEAAGAGIGRGMGLYEAAALVGAAVGAVLAGALYQGGSWTTACLVLALPSLAGAVLGPWAVGRLGVRDRPVATPPEVAAAPVPAGAPAVPDAAATAPAAAVGDTAGSDGRTAGRRTGSASSRDPRRQLSLLAAHAVLFVLVQVLLALVDLSWVVDVASAEQGWDALLRGARPGLEGLPGFVHGVGRIWVIVFAVDVVWTACTVLAALRRGGPDRASHGSGTI
ncbi:MFS transporter [Blastococcus sp. SYSU DS0616]